MSRNSDPQTTTTRTPSVTRRSARIGVASVVACAALAAGSRVSQADGQIGDVFYIALENHNFSQPNGNVSQAAGVSSGTVYAGIQQIKNNPNCPFQNALVNGTAFVNVGGTRTDLSTQVSYAAAYHNVGATPDGTGAAGLHPSEPN